MYGTYGASGSPAQYAMFQQQRKDQQLQNLLNLFLMMQQKKQQSGQQEFENKLTTQQAQDLSDYRAKTLDLRQQEINQPPSQVRLYKYYSELPEGEEKSFLSKILPQSPAEETRQWKAKQDYMAGLQRGNALWEAQVRAGTEKIDYTKSPDYKLWEMTKNQIDDDIDYYQTLLNKKPQSGYTDLQTLGKAMSGHEDEYKKIISNLEDAKGELMRLQDSLGQNNGILSPQEKKFVLTLTNVKSVRKGSVFSPRQYSETLGTINNTVGNILGAFGIKTKEEKSRKLSDTGSSFLNDILKSMPLDLLQEGRAQGLDDTSIAQAYMRFLQENKK